MLKKNILKNGLLFLLTFLIIYVLYRNGLIEVDAIVYAMKHGRGYIFAAVGMLACMNLFLFVRYKLLLKRLEVNFPSSQVAAATFVSNALGQWSPGSIAIIEIIRVSLMIGTGKSIGPIEGIKSKLAVASLIDRLLGFFTMLLAGGTVCAIIYFGQRETLKPPTDVLLLALCLGSLGLGFIIALLPYFAASPFANKIASYLSGASDQPQNPRVFSSVLKKAFTFFGKLQRVVSQSHWKQTGFGFPFLISLCVMTSTCFALYFCSKAMGVYIPLAAIFAVFPIMAVANTLPIGVGGFGGQQLVAIAIFQIFSLESSQVSSAYFLYAALILFVNTIFGAVWAGPSIGQLKSIFKTIEVT